jgi:hypothetical protein
MKKIIPIVMPRNGSKHCLSERLAFFSAPSLVHVLTIIFNVPAKASPHVKATKKPKAQSIYGG